VARAVNGCYAIRPPRLLGDNFAVKDETFGRGRSSSLASMVHIRKEKVKVVDAIEAIIVE